MDWLQVVQSVGIPVSILAVMFYAAWRVGSWMGINVIVPIRDAHLKFIETVSGSVVQTTLLLQQISGSLVNVEKIVSSAADAAASAARAAEKAAAAAAAAASRTPVVEQP